MRQLTLTFVGALSLSLVALPIEAKEEASKKADDPAQLLQNNPIKPQAVGAHGVIDFPGDVDSFHFITAVGNQNYTVCPSRFLDVVMVIKVRGFRAKTVDRHFAGGCESFSFSVPRHLPVTVSIKGFRGSTGAWRFLARP
jgi:hypothetical protein